MKRRRREEAAAAAAAGSMEDDRISQLPQHILHHILSLLPRKDAVRTCILSKSWRSLISTRPCIEFYETSFPGKRHEFLSVVQNTLQRYDDQKLLIQAFDLEMSARNDSKNTISVLDKLIPIVLSNMGLKTFRFSADAFPLPPVVFQAEFLEELFLKLCNLNQIFNSTGKVQTLKRLRTLSLDSVIIEEETFEKIMSIFPLIQHLVLKYCRSLSTIKVKTARNLKHFECEIYSLREKDNNIEINDAPSLETIRINDCKNWYLNNNSCFFPRLKSLYLWKVHLPTELLNNLSSNNCPCLEELELLHCSGFSKFKLSSYSINRLIIRMPVRPMKTVIIDAANILYFEFVSDYIPSISFATTSKEWKSHIHVGRCSSYLSADVIPAFYLKLYEFLKALSQSQIYLDISYLSNLKNGDNCEGDSCEPLVVEHLCLTVYSSYEVPALLHNAIRICRPRYIGLPLHFNSQEIYAEPIWKTLVEKGKTNFWQQDLEETSIQVSDKNTNEWRSVQVCALSKNQNIRFRLKWRDLS